MLVDTGRYYNFSNVRYAQPPVGELRFRLPKAPLTNRTGVNNGQDGRVCPQGSPPWSQERALFLKAYSAYSQGQGSIEPFTRAPPPGFDTSPKPPPATDGRESEDCLFLEVIVPTGVFSQTKKAPVVIWTYGGGFYSGNIQSQGNPAGLVARSIANPATAPGVVYVSINYRLGALGWLAGPTFSESGGVQQYIYLFGGDPARVTVMGESVGAAMNIHQITAHGDNRDTPFQQAVMISPAFNPNPYNTLQEATFKKFLTYANVTSLAELRALDSEKIIAANSLAIYNSTYGATAFGPVVDSKLAIFTGHNTNEGFLFTDPSTQNITAFNAQVASYLPDAANQTLDLIENSLYPPTFNQPSKLSYNDSISRLSTLSGDFIVNCNMYALLESFNSSSPHGFLFAEGGGLHGEETPYTFNTDGPEADVYGFGKVNGTVAEALQDWLLTFTAKGDPNGAEEPKIPVYGTKRELGLLSNKGLGASTVDPAGKERCEFWNKELYT
ncbi:MAG: hypothetical protein Q9168_003334 [Polycauliona sp. 1 TL-2023]